MTKVILNYMLYFKPLSNCIFERLITNIGVFLQLCPLPTIHPNLRLILNSFHHYLPLHLKRLEYNWVANNWNHPSRPVMLNAQLPSEVSLFAAIHPMNEICWPEKEGYYRAVPCFCKSIQTYFYARRFQQKNGGSHPEKSTMSSCCCCCCCCGDIQARKERRCRKLSRNWEIWSHKHDSCHKS